jgi:copper(I)-binding protein
VIRSRSGRTVANRLLIGALALLIPAITGCEAGLNAPTLEFHPASSGANAIVNGIKINNVFVLSAPSGSSVPAGASAGMFLALFNGGTNADQLVGVSAPGSAASVRLSGGTVSLPVQSSVNLTGPHPEVVLNGLTRPLSGGQAVRVIFNFQHAGAVTLDVPVEPQSFSFATFSPPPNAAALGSATAAQ